jgi:bifunctional non-homologous end joining protein LigD
MIGRPPKPMKAVMGTLPTDDAGWGYEIKWDGFRALTVIDGERVRVFSPNGIDVTAKRSELTTIHQSLHGDQAVLDGEMLAMDEDGRFRFELLQAAEAPVTYLVFDILELQGQDLIALPYEDRRRLLDQAVEPGANWLLSPWQVGGGAALLEASRAQGLEGVMAKRLDSPYLPGRRSPAWRKIKNRHRQELVVGGWTSGTGNRASTFGALLVGYYDDGVLRYGGGVGTGFNEATLAKLTPRLKAMTIGDCPFDPRPTPTQLRHQRPHWVQPTLVCEVEFAEWTHDGIVRHASYIGLRDDKPPTKVVREPSP